MRRTYLLLVAPFILMSCGIDPDPDLPRVPDALSPACVAQEPTRFIGGEALNCAGYPKQNHEGISLEIDIDASGRVARVTTLAPRDAEVDACVQRTVRTWEYLPARTCDGTPTARTIRQAYWALSGL